MHEEKPGQLFKYTGPQSALMTTSWLEFLWSSHEWNDPTRPTKERHHSRKVKSLWPVPRSPHGWWHVTLNTCYRLKETPWQMLWCLQNHPAWPVWQILRLSHSLVRSMQTSSPLDRLISLKFNWLWVSLWWWSLYLSILQMYKRHSSCWKAPQFVFEFSFLSLSNY